MATRSSPVHTVTAEASPRSARAIALERDVVRGTATPHAGAQTLAQELADHLRALLRDVICGHLDPDLIGIADELLLASAVAPAETDDADAQEHSDPPDARPSVEQVLGDPSQAQEILDVFI